ncbi:hypothetical protein ABT299_50065 [Spirillospora sp. NPDC000708]
MAENDALVPPEDLVEVQRAWYAADAECARIGEALPSGSKVVAGVEAAPKQVAELKAARARRLQFTEDLLHHEWWGKVTDPIKAKKALRAAAKQ